MLSKKKAFSNFSKSVQTYSYCFRPDNEEKIKTLFDRSIQGLLARGNGLSYSDCCLNDEGTVIDTSRLNHFLSFDEQTGLVVCQGNVSFAELLELSPHYIPPVIPGTLKATIGGGVANDVHGKNNHKEGSLGQHLQWLELQLGTQSIRCDQENHADLFYATIGGLGLTGFIKKVALKMRKASHFVLSRYEKFNDFESLVQRMQNEGPRYDYQVAWLDLLNEPAAILSLANHCAQTKAIPPSPSFSIPKLPLRLINSWIMKKFNRLYFQKHPTEERHLSLAIFNNPLDYIANWNRLYGKQGLLQFQALIDEDIILIALPKLLEIIQTYQATATLAVLKYFSSKGLGLLSFTQPGFTIAIDFIHNDEAKSAMVKMNEWITQVKGKIYLAKDLFLTQKQFREQYQGHQEFSQLLNQYNSIMCSDLSKRLGIRQ